MAWSCVVLHGSVLCFMVLCYGVVLCCGGLSLLGFVLSYRFCVVLCCVVLHCIVLCGMGSCVVLWYAVSFRLVLNCVVLCYVALSCLVSCLLLRVLSSVVFGR